jgi:hypothetical protein
MTIKERTKSSKEDEEIPPPIPPPALREFPDAYYCPITKQIMQDPVVTWAGDSFERSAIIKDSRHNVRYKLYANRALQSIITEAVSLQGDSTRAGLARLTHSMRSNFSRLLEISAIPSDEHRPLPDSFYCPITFNLIQKPVIDPEGNSYERAAIEHWIRANNNSPMTRTALSIDQLYDNNAITDLMNEERERSDESIHPSIRRWKEETPTNDTNDLENGGSATTNTYPTTPQEIEERRRQHRAKPFTIVAIIVAVVIICFFFPAMIGIILFFACWCFPCCVFCFEGLKKCYECFVTSRT